jgi:hypothetical protein
MQPDRRDLKAHYLFDRYCHQKFPGKKKRNTPAGQFWSPAEFFLFHHWIMPIFLYVVHLDVSLIMDGEDRKRTFRLGVVYVEQ